MLEVRNLQINKWRGKKKASKQHFCNGSALSTVQREPFAWENFQDVSAMGKALVRESKSPECDAAWHVEQRGIVHVNEVGDWF